MSIDASLFAAQKEILSSLHHPPHDDYALLKVAISHYTMASSSKTSLQRTHMHLNTAIMLLNKINYRSYHWHREYILAHLKRADLLKKQNKYFEAVKDYLSIIVLFNVFFIVSYCLEVLTKADGFPHLAIIGVIISAITNVILDYIFVIELGLGVKGAAIATGISQIASFLFFASHFLRKKSTLKLVKFKPTFNILKRIIKIGFPDGITELTSGIVILIFNQCILLVIGENGLITYSIICYVSTLVLMTMIGSTQGVQPLCSYYYGKKDVNSIKYLLKLSFKTITLISLTIFILCLIFAPQIVSLFITDGSSKLIKDSILAFRLYSTSFLLLGFNILCSGFCVSIEKPLLATIISLSRGFVLIIISLILCILLFGGKGIWISPIICEIGCLFISFLCTKKSFNSILNTTKDCTINKENIM